MLLLQVAKEKKVAGQNSQEQIASLSSEEKEKDEENLNTEIVTKRIENLEE